MNTVTTRQGVISRHQQAGGKSGWRRLRFEEMAENVTDRVDDPSKAGVERYVGLEHLDPESLNIVRWGTPDQVEATKLRFKPGDIIFGKRRAYQRKLAVANFEGICSAHAMVLRAREEAVLQGFLPVFMQSEIFFERALAISVGSLSPTINWKTLAAQEFSIPPQDKQRRIAEILWATDDAIVRFREVLFQSSEVQDTALNTVLREGLTGGILMETEHGRIPKHWSSRTIGDLCDLSGGNGFTPRDWAKNGLPIIRIQNLNGSREFNYFAGEPEPEWIVEPGTLLFAWAGVKGVSFGPCIWPGPRGVLNQHIHRIRPRDGVDKVWLFETLKAFTRTIEKRAHGFKLELVHLRKAEITGQVVPVPPLSEQTQIAKVSEQFNQAQIAQEQHLARLVETKKSLMRELLRA